MGAHFLDRLFAPQAIAVFGASKRPESVGTRVFDNLRSGGFSGRIYAVNPKYKRLHNKPCYPSIKAIGKHVDLAVIATPAKTIPEIIHECGEHGVRAVIIISAGINIGGNRDTSLNKTIFEAARQYQMRILGPNCLGLIRPAAGMNATFSKNTAKPGQLALISQSGALCTSILDWAADHDIGFSAIVSLGDAADIDFGDILDYLAQDPKTSSILLYVEGVRAARSFKGIGSNLMSALIDAARRRGIKIMDGEILANNSNMLALVKSLGFTINVSVNDPGIREAKKLL